MSPGDLVYYYRFGGPTRGLFPFGESNCEGLGVVVSEMMTYDAGGDELAWVWILDEDGNMSDFLIDYLRPVTT